MNAQPPAVRLQPEQAESLISSRFAVPSMKCAGCMGKIEKGLSQHAAIRSARVNFSAKTVSVSHLPELNENDVRQQIEQLGFPAQLMADNPLSEDKSATRSLILALGVAGFGMMNIMLLSVGVWSGAGGLTREFFHIISAIIALPVIAYSGRTFFASAAMALRYGRTNMDVPVSIGIILATSMSLYETLMGGAHAYFDGVVMLIFFLLTGRVLDGMMRDRARAGIASLLKETAPGGMVCAEDGSSHWMRISDIQPGMRLLVAAGERLAADGIIAKGAGLFDCALITGESAPILKSVGDEVFAGTMNLDAPIMVTVTAQEADSSLAQMALLMDDAAQLRSFHVRVADKAARIYAPAVHSLALLAFAGWMIAGAGWHQSITIAIAVLIITCPCALGLAVPAAQVVASGALMKRGLLIKDGSALERLADVDYALFDKTGSLTLGAPRPSDLTALSAEDKSVALALAQASRHPISRGLQAMLQAHNVVPAALDDLAETAGSGVSATWQGQAVRLGRPDLKTDSMATMLTMGERHFILPFNDPLRPDAAQVLAQFSQMGIGASIVSGDADGAVRAVALELGIDGKSAALPQDKVAAVQLYSAMGHKVLMVGDGLNDGPALAAAYASIAPSSASDVGQQAADAVFVSASLMPVLIAVKGAKATMANVRQNFALAILYNVCAIPLALAGMVTPLIAALAMSCSSLIVVANALRLRRIARMDEVAV